MTVDKLEMIKVDKAHSIKMNVSLCRLSHCNNINNKKVLNNNLIQVYEENLKILKLLKESR